MRLAVVRPLPDGERTAQSLRARGHDVTLAPVIEIESVEADVAEQCGAVIMTSANAARAVAAHARRDWLVGLPCFAVGARSAEAAREAGFADVTSADGDTGDLARLIDARCQTDVPLLYLAGEDRAADLPGTLGKKGFAVKTVVVYRAVPLPIAPPLAGALRAGAVDGVLHFSARSAMSYLDGAREAGLIAPALRPRHFCLSAQVAAPLTAAGAAYVSVSARPDERALLECVEQ